MKWLITSIVLSVGLTMLLNAFTRSRPDLSNRANDWLQQQTARSTSDDDGRRVRVYAPWKAMLLGSLILTVVLNLLIRLV